MHVCFAWPVQVRLHGGRIPERVAHRGQLQPLPGAGLPLPRHHHPPPAGARHAAHRGRGVPGHWPECRLQCQGQGWRRWVHGEAAPHAQPWGSTSTVPVWPPRHSLTNASMYTRRIDVFTAARAPCPHSPTPWLLQGTGPGAAVGMCGTGPPDDWVLPYRLMRQWGPRSVGRTASCKCTDDPRSPETVTTPAVHVGVRCVDVRV
jgi:hypothetical protein